MKIAITRRICQVFFFLLFLWFCVVTTLGQQWWQLRGWPVNWLIQLDPLVGLATLLSTRTVYAGLLWGLSTMALTIVLGRFFCGWMCPFGAIHQFVGYLANRTKSAKEKIKGNRYYPLQSIKYFVLIFLLTVSALELAREFLFLPVTASLQIGLLDPISLVTRSFNLVVLPLLDETALSVSVIPRVYEGAGLIGVIFLSAVLLNLIIPRFYCRFICPAGALFGILSRFAVWRIGKNRNDCIDCRLCERHCEGACQPTSKIRFSECVLCMNCLDDCRHQLMTYQIKPSASGESVSTDLSRRQFLASVVSGAAVIPMLRVGGYVNGNWDPTLVRPPGALAEEAFLSRCIKCGQCMRVCPTNVIHPAGIKGGLEGLWTPVLNFRMGTSGCQFNCIACGNLCPTAAIRPITLDERLGKKDYAETGPIRIGTAFIDRGHCLPWAMNIPCIVCQENCPVSPKAIGTRLVFSTVYAKLIVSKGDSLYVEFQDVVPHLDRFATGDYYAAIPSLPDEKPRRIVSCWERGLRIADGHPFEAPPSPGTPMEIRVRLQQPYVDPNECIGCGVCEHECPVPGKRAIRVTADNESRSPEHTLILRRR